MPFGEEGPRAADGEQELLLTDLPPDALHAIARQLVCVQPHRCSAWASALTSLIAVQHLTTLCTILRSALLADEVMWSMLISQRDLHWDKGRHLCGVAEAAGAAAESSRGKGRAESRLLCQRVWALGMWGYSSTLASLPRLTPDTDAASVCSANVVHHGTPLSMPLSMPLSDAVEIETWERTAEQVRTWLDGDVAPAVALEWLVYPPKGSAAPDALTQLAVISALRRCKAAQREGGSLSPSLAAELQAVGPLPLGWLQTRLEVKRFSWSQSRDCRGFRARDDVVVRRATLRELATCDEIASSDIAEIWGVLARGATYEVQRVTLRVL